MTGEDVVLAVLESEDGSNELDDNVYISISGIFNSIAFGNDDAKQVRGLSKGMSNASRDQREGHLSRPRTILMQLFSSQRLLAKGVGEWVVSRMLARLDKPDAIVAGMAALRNLSSNQGKAEGGRALGTRARL